VQVYFARRCADRKPIRGPYILPGTRDTILRTPNGGAEVSIPRRADILRIFTRGTWAKSGRSLPCNPGLTDRRRALSFDHEDATHRHQKMVLGPGLGNVFDHSCFRSLSLWQPGGFDSQSGTSRSRVLSDCSIAGTRRNHHLLRPAEVVLECRLPRRSVGSMERRSVTA